MEDQVAEEVKLDRMARLVETVQRVAAARNAARVGGSEEVLVEGPSRAVDTLLRGRTRRNTTVVFSGTAAPGELANVEITGSTSTTLRGRQLALVAA
jgi:tRNA-2-methylthio-N6-dimethylallyladenosine synthase